MSSESRAVLFYLKSLRVRLFILGDGVISVTALSARKSDRNSLTCSHIYLTIIRQLRACLRTSRFEVITERYVTPFLTSADVVACIESSS